MAMHTDNSLFLEEIGAVTPPGLHHLLFFGYRQRQIKLCRLLSDPNTADLEPLQTDLFFRFFAPVMEPERHVIHRRLSYFSLRPHLFDQLLKRRLLMGVCAKRHILHPHQQFPESRITADVRPERQHVDKETDERLYLYPIPVQQRYAYNDVFLRGVHVEQRLECREQKHKRAYSLSPTQCPDRLT